MLLTLAQQYYILIFMGVFAARIKKDKERKKERKKMKMIHKVTIRDRESFKDNR